MPVYQAETWLPAALESALGQTFEDFELIAIDDGSTDKSGEILDFWSQQDNRLRVVHAPHGGLPRARERSLQEAHGRYAAFLDADDTWLPHRLERQLPYVDETTVVFSNASLADESGPLSMTYSEIVPPPQVEWPASGLFQDLLRRGSFIPMLTVLAPVELLRKAGSFRRAERAGYGSTGGSCDFEMWLVLSLQGVKFHYVDEPLAEHLSRRSSLSADVVSLGVEGLRIFDSLESDANGADLQELKRSRKRVREHLEIAYRKHAWRLIVARDRKGARRELVASLRARPTAIRAWLALALFTIPPVARRLAVHGLSDDA